MSHHNLEFGNAAAIQVILMLVLRNFVETPASIPAGMFSDRLSRKKVIVVAWFVYALFHLGFAFATGLWQPWLLFTLYGAHYDIIGGVSRTFVITQTG